MLFSEGAELVAQGREVYLPAKACGQKLMPLRHKDLEAMIHIFSVVSGNV